MSALLFSPAGMTKRDSLKNLHCSAEALLRTQSPRRSLLEGGRWDCLAVLAIFEGPILPIVWGGSGSNGSSVFQEA
jgi:hypothetical protein